MLPCPPRLRLKIVLACSIIGSALVKVAPLQAQPGTAPPNGAKDYPALTPERKAAVAKVLGWEHQAELCNARVSLKVTNGTLQDIVAKIGAAFPRQTRIEVRSTSAARFTLDLRNATVGEVLDAAASLAGDAIWIFSDHILLAPAETVPPAELSEAKSWSGDLSSGLRSYASAEGEKLFLDVISSTLASRTSTATTTGQVTIGELSPELQQMLQQLVTWTVTGYGFGTSPDRIPRLTTDGLVAFSAAGTRRNLSLTLASSQRTKLQWESNHDGNGESFSSGGQLPPVTIGPRR